MWQVRFISGVYTFFDALALVSSLLQAYFLKKAKKMNKVIYILALVFLQTSILAFGQAQLQNINDQPYIEVVGVAENEIIPNEIYIEILIRERYINKVKVSIEEQEDKLKSAVKSLAIDPKDLYLSDANADYLKVRWQKKDVLTKKEYTLKVSNATTVGQVFLELEKLEITDAHISKVNHSKIDSLLKEVKIQAIKAAKNKSDYLLAAIGEQTGRALVIKENEMLSNTSVSNTRGSRSGDTELYIDGVKMKYEDSSEIQFQKIKIQTSVYAKFAIK